MLILGIVLLALGYILGIGILTTIGWLLAIVGLVLLLVGALGNSVGGRRYWY